VIKENPTERITISEIIKEIEEELKDSLLSHILV